jgi:hypothetical protein
MCYGRFRCFLESAVRLAERPHEDGPERLVFPAVDQKFGEGASSRSGREACREQLQPVLVRVSTGESATYGGRGGRMMAAISIGIIIIVAVIVAAHAIIYFVLKGSPR